MAVLGHGGVGVAVAGIEGCEVSGAEADARQTEIPDHVQGAGPDVEPVGVGGVGGAADGQNAVEDGVRQQGNCQQRRHGNQGQQPLVPQGQEHHGGQGEADPAGTGIGHHMYLTFAERNSSHSGARVVTTFKMAFLNLLIIPL